MDIKSTVVACGAFVAATFGCGNLGRQQQSIIGGSQVAGIGEQNLGLVSVSATAGGCSGVLLDERWVLTAGHCFAQGVPQFATVTLLAKAVASEEVYVFGNELKPDGRGNSRGYDLALIRLREPITPGPFRQRELMTSPPFATGRSAVHYGKGFNTYYQPGPPPMAPVSGTWRQANLTIGMSLPNANAGWPNLLVASANVSGQVCAPGDSGGPVFLLDGEPQPKLLGIQIGGDYVCANGSNAQTCKATITAISSCKSLMIPLRAVEQIMAKPWHRIASTWVFDAGNEIVPYLFFDPSREVDIDVNVRSWNIMARAGDEMCFNRGFVGGHMTGEQARGELRVACAGTGAVWRDAITADVANTTSAFVNLETTPWAHARRAAHDICVKYGYVGGHFNGFQRDAAPGLPGFYGLVCYGAPALWLDATTAEIEATGSPLGDLNQEPWAKAARAATAFCKSRGHSAGFMTGHQAPGKFGVVCQRTLQFGLQRGDMIADELVKP